MFQMWNSMLSEPITFVKLIEISHTILSINLSSFIIIIRKDGCILLKIQYRWTSLLRGNVQKHSDKTRKDTQKQGDRSSGSRRRWTPLTRDLVAPTPCCSGSRCYCRSPSSRCDWLKQSTAFNLSHSEWGIANFHRINGHQNILYTEFVVPPSSPLDSTLACWFLLAPCRRCSTISGRTASISDIDSMLRSVPS